MFANCCFVRQNFNKIYIFFQIVLKFSFIYTFDLMLNTSRHILNFEFWYSKQTSSAECQHPLILITFLTQIFSLSLTTSRTALYADCFSVSGQFGPFSEDCSTLTPMRLDASPTEVNVFRNDVPPITSEQAACITFH